MSYISELFSITSYVFNPYFIPPIISATLVIVLGCSIFAIDRESQFNRSFMYLCISAAVAFYGHSLVFSSRTETVALFWTKILYAGLIFCPATIFHISIAYTERYRWEHRYVRSVYAVAVLFVAATFSRDFIEGVREYFWGFYPDAGVLHPVFLVFILYCLILGLVNLLTYYRMCSAKEDRKRTKYLIISFILTGLINIDLLPSYGIALYPFGYVAILCFVLSMTYSIIKYHNLRLRHYTSELEQRVTEKTTEISRVLDELRATQVKLIETGKISALASLSAGILHQVSQPVTAIHGFVKFLKKEMNPEYKFYKAIGLMEEQSVYLKDMLEDLMELIRHREIKKDYVNINTSLKRATDLLTDELRIKRVEWEIYLANNLPELYADAIHLQQVFMNIIVNAIQALATLPKGSSRQLKIVSRFDQQENKVVVIFKDNGPGLSLDDQKQIFEPFFSTKTKGSGIGLALCKDLIAEHGGDITLQSTKGTGATFIITFPVPKKQ